MERPPGRRRVAGGIPWLLRLEISQRRQAGGVVIGLLCEAAAAIALSTAGAPSHWLGVTGAVGVLIAVVVAVVSGTQAGVIVAAGGGIMFVAAASTEQTADPLLGGALVIVVWTAAAFVTGSAAAELRRRATSAYAELEVAHDRAVRIATTLQRSLIPATLPPVEGLEIGSYFRPAGDGSEIGGDFYDLWRIGPDGFGAVVGDVCGKGTQAAAITALARHTIRTASIIDSRPCAALDAVNAALLNRVEDRARFITAIALTGTTMPGHAAIQLCIGGHPMPLLVDVDGTVHETGHPGTLLGVLDQAQLTMTRLDLLPGQSLVIYTDGLTENRGPAGFFGETRVAKAAAAVAQAPADELARHLAAESQAFSRAPARDDTVILVIRKT